jgi:hypothetical protein
VLLVLALDVSTPGQSSRLSFLVERSGLTDASRRRRQHRGRSSRCQARRRRHRLPLLVGSRSRMRRLALLCVVTSRGSHSRDDARVERQHLGARSRPVHRWVRWETPPVMVQHRRHVFVGVAYERGLLGLVLFVGAFGSFLFGTRRAATSTVHWYSPPGFGSRRPSFCWDSYSTFNILVMGSMAIAMWYEDQALR